MWTWWTGDGMTQMRGVIEQAGLPACSPQLIWGHVDVPKMDYVLRLDEGSITWHR